jgi:membrane fusion protein (multidrug efflux system)
MEATKPKVVPISEDKRPHAPEPQPKPPRRGKKPFLILAAVLGVALLGIGGYVLLTADQQATDDAQIEADVVPIGVRVSGQVAHVTVKENQRVKKGDLLIQIDDADYAARVKQAEAELETANAQAQAADSQEQVVEATAKGGLSSARAVVSGSSMGVTGAEAQIAAARASLERARAEARKSDLDLSRAKDLRASNSIPQGQLDDVQAQHDVTQAALAQATAQLTAAEEQRLMAQSRVAEARGKLDQSAPIDAQIAAARANAALAHARVKSAEASLDLARLQLSYTKILATDDGVVSALNVHEGALVNVNQPVAELVPSYTYVVANFKETEVGRMHAGERAVVTIDAFPGQKLEGRVDSLSGGTGARFSLLPPDNASGNFVKVVQRVPVRIAWTEPPSLPLRAGLSVGVTVYLDK